MDNVGVATDGCIEGLSKIIDLIHAGILPKSVSYSAVEELMVQDKLAMMISGPWAWSKPESAWDQIRGGTGSRREWKAGSPICWCDGCIR